MLCVCVCFSCESAKLCAIVSTTMNSKLFYITDVASIWILNTIAEKKEERNSNCSFYLSFNPSKWKRNLAARIKKKMHNFHKPFAIFPKWYKVDGERGNQKIFTPTKVGGGASGRRSEKVTKWFEEETTVTRRVYERPKKKGEWMLAKKNFYSTSICPIQRMISISMLLLFLKLSIFFLPSSGACEHTKITNIDLFYEFTQKLWEVTFQQFHFIHFDGSERER